MTTVLILCIVILVCVLVNTMLVVTLRKLNINLDKKRIAENPELKDEEDPDKISSQTLTE